ALASGQPNPIVPYLRPRHSDVCSLIFIHPSQVSTPPAGEDCMRSSPQTAVSTVLCALVAVGARAQFPYPADPNRCDSSSLPLGCIPLANEMGGCNGEHWKYARTSVCTTDPLVLTSANELNGVSGMSVDISWRVETGRSDVVIAVHDSGIEWN